MPLQRTGQFSGLWADRGPTCGVFVESSGPERGIYNS
jgi:hypothetical protein